MDDLRRKTREMIRKKRAEVEAERARLRKRAEEKAQAERAANEHIEKMRREIREANEKREAEHRRIYDPENWLREHNKPIPVIYPYRKITEKEQEWFSIYHPEIWKYWHSYDEPCRCKLGSCNHIFDCMVNGCCRFCEPIWDEQYWRDNCPTHWTRKGRRIEREHAKYKKNVKK